MSIRGVWFGLLVGLLGVCCTLVAPGDALASNNSSYDTAYAACEAYHLIDHYGPGAPTSEACLLESQQHAIAKVGCLDNGVCRFLPANWGSWAFQGNVPICSIDQASFGTPHMQWPDDMAGPQCIDGCIFDFEGDDKISGISYSGGQWVRFGDFVPSGAACDPNSTPPVIPQAPPKPCGGQSCYDPQHGFCAVTEGGEQICTGDDPPPSGCITGATGAVCTSPQSGPPPTPPSPPITPQTPPTGQDVVQTMDQQGNPQPPIVVQTYNGSGSPPATPGSSGGPPGMGDGGTGGSSNGTGSGNSGQNGTDKSSGKCPDGSVPTAGGCSATVADSGCASPPVCSGDAILCGIYKQDQIARCGSAKLLDLVQHPGANGDEVDPYDLSGAPAPASVEKSTDLGDTSGLDSGGFGYGGSCPAADMTVDLGGSSFVIPFSRACDWGALLRAFVLAFAYLGAAKIIAGVR